jgi:peroxiredoxin
MGSARRKQLLGVGHRAPGFQLRELKGGSRNLEEALANGPALLAFFKITCPVCQLEFPFLERIHREAAPGSVALYGVSQDDEEWTRDFNRSYGITFPTLLDSAAERYPASNAFGISIVPTALLIEPDGTVSWALEGFHKGQIQALAGKFGVDPFRPDEFVPESKAG